MASRQKWVALLGVLPLVALGACSGGGDGDPAATATTAPGVPDDSTSAAAGNLPDGFGRGPAGKGLDRFYRQDVRWESCGSGRECASIWVPLDYADPDGTAITVKAERQPAGDESARRGSLFINPGGPGGSGIDYLSYVGLDSSVTDVYDVVGFDPRGVGASTPIDCLSDEDLDAYIASEPSPDTPAEVSEFEDTWSHFTSGCETRSGKWLGHVSTIEVARDLDIMRNVVGDDGLNYFGASYGTYIGATYAGLFPQQVDRMVLDGAIDPLADPLTSQVKQTVGFEQALDGYLQFCVDSGDCPLGSDVDAARDRLVQLLDDIDASPLPTSSGRELTEGLAFLGIIVPLYDESTWGLETQGLQAAVDGKGDALLALADAYTGRQPDGTYKNNSMEVQSAVNCLDHPQDESLQEIEAGARTFERRAPVFGQVGMWFPYGCSNWPEKAGEPAPDFSAPGAAPILVVGTTRDPATPYGQAVALANELDSGVLLTRDGDGHTAYGRGNACIDEAINSYLVTGDPPEDGTVC
jgi:pimeloyl-ACP methyl ester carboxylesterase